MTEPRVGDPVIVGTTKYRIRSIHAWSIVLKASLTSRHAVIAPWDLQWEPGWTSWQADRCTPTR